MEWRFGEVPIEFFLGVLSSSVFPFLEKSRFHEPGEERKGRRGEVGGKERGEGGGEMCSEVRLQRT